jgi:hypothetical protein
MFYFVGFWMAIIADAIGVGDVVDRFGWWLYKNERMAALGLGIHDGIMRDLG